MSKTASNFWKPFGLAFLGAMGVGVLGAVVTELGPWYQNLTKPAWQPPDLLFGPVWTLIFGLTALSGVLAWRKAPAGVAGNAIIALFVLNFALNILWSYLFFRAHHPDWALFEVGFLWLSVLVPIFVTSRYSKTAAWLLVAYISWVTFAGLLNNEIVRLNPAAMGG